MYPIINAYLRQVAGNGTSSFDYFSRVTIVGTMKGQAVVTTVTESKLVPLTDLRLQYGGPPVAEKDLESLPVFAAWGMLPGQVPVSAEEASPPSSSASLEEDFQKIQQGLTEMITETQEVLDLAKAALANDWADPAIKTMEERDADAAAAGDVVVAPPQEVLDKLPCLPFAPHTMYILCGPSGCGKSTFANDLKELLTDEFGLPVVFLSSDGFRFDVLQRANLPAGEISSERHSDVWGAVSGPAFRGLDWALDTSLNSLVSTPYVIVDTTAFSVEFRQELVNKAEAAGYQTCLVLFNYGKNANYALPEGATAAEKAAAASSLVKMNRKVLPSIDRSMFNKHVTIKSRDMFDWRSKPWGHSGSDVDWDKAILERALPGDAHKVSMLIRNMKGVHEDLPVAVIGDSHECAEELQALVKQLCAAMPGGGDLILVGDFLDKGGDTLKMIGLVHSLMFEAPFGDLYGLDVVVGNHENYVLARLKGEISEPNLEMERENFSSVAALTANTKEARIAVQQFFRIMNKAHEFLMIQQGSGSVPFYVTHAPCQTKYLGKVSGDALRAQRNFRVETPSDNFYEELRWFYDGADRGAPLHFFGHVASFPRQSRIPVEGNIRYKNKVFMDTGAVYGGFLTGVIVRKGKIDKVLAVKSSVAISREGKKPIPIELACPPIYQVYNRADYKLTLPQLRQLEHIVNGNEGRIRYISGTMAPAPSKSAPYLPRERGAETGASEAEGSALAITPELESLSGALSWYKDRGVDKVVVEPKHMGSRGNLYLFEGKPEETFLTSRNGWKVRGLEGLSPEEFTLFLKILHLKYQTKGVLAEYGDVIIDGEIMPWDTLGRGLIRTAFETYYALANAESTVLMKHLSVEALGASGLNIRNIPWLEATYSSPTTLAEFKEAVQVFGSPGQPAFMAFSILHSSKKGLLEAVPEEEVYLAVADRPDHLVLDLTDEHFASSLEAAQTMFAHLEEQRKEGVVIKPSDRLACARESTKGFPPPYLKVRNEWYLRLVYGHDFTNDKKYRMLVAGKTISGKVKLSLQEHALGQRLLTASPEEKEEIVVKMIGMLEEERVLDPRL
jgi:energy-coupling factor transporter ATP-binding protein EcfA2